MNPNDPYAPGESNENAEAASAAKAWQSAKEKAGESYAAGERYVREHPGSSVLTIFGAGFLLGVLVGWAAAREEDDSYSARLSDITKRLRRQLDI